MNRIKVTIKNDKGDTIFKMGSSVKAQDEYSDLEVADIIQDLSSMIKLEVVNNSKKTHKQLEFNF